jgi:hypothetical protein
VVRDMTTRIRKCAYLMFNSCIYIDIYIIFYFLEPTSVIEFVNCARLGAPFCTTPPPTIYRIRCA